MACLIKEGKYYAENGQPSKLYNDLEKVVGEAQAKDLFVLAHTPQFLKEVQAPLIWNYKNKFPATPYAVDFQEKFSGKTRIIQQFEEGKAKGKMQLVAYKDGYKIKSVFVNEEDRGKGLGKSLYVYAIRQLIAEGKNLYSDQIRTSFADSIWNSLETLGVTSENNKIIYAKPLSAFDENGEIYAENVLNYATALNENTQELSFVDQQEVRTMMSEFPYIEDSDELSDRFTKAFYKDGLFAPTRDSLSGLYSNYEIDTILSDVSILGQVKESIEKLKRTDTIQNSTVLEAVYKTKDLNKFGKLKTENPYKISQDIVEEFGGVENPDLSEVKDRTITAEYLEQFKRIPSIDESGNPIIEEVIYPTAVKVVEDEKVFEAIDALIEAPLVVDTSKLEQKLSKWLLNYGINIEGFTKDLLPTLKAFLRNPSVENTKAFSDKCREVFNVPEKVRERVTKIENKDRDLVFLETNRTEQELFDEQNLLQTELVNVYHRIEKVDFQEMKDALNLPDTITELQAYKDYFNYNTTPITKIQKFTPVTLENDLNYLTNEFIADFNIEKLKNPENELYNKFKITEKGIEQIYKDPISTAEIQAYIADGAKLGKELQEYSIISKQMDNLMEENVTAPTNRYNNRISAINNFEMVKIPVGDFTKLNQITLIVKNGVEEFLNNENQLFELQNKDGNMSIYTRIEKNNNLNYNEMSPQIPTQQQTNLRLTTQQLEEYSKIKKQWKSEDVGNKFDCL